MLIALLVPLALATLGFTFLLARAAIANRAKPTVEALVLGAITNFFDTLGIGSFAPTTSLYKLTGVVSDEEIPGTMNIGHAVPTFAEAFIIIAAVDHGRRVRTAVPHVVPR